MNNNTSETQKRIKFLEKRGWKLVEPEFNLDYLIELGPEKILKEVGYYFSDFAGQCSKNPFAFLSKDLKESYDTCVRNITPLTGKIEVPNNWPCIFANFPSDKDITDSTIDKAFEELTYRTIIKICQNVLPPAKAIYQTFNNHTMSYIDTANYDFTNKEIFNTVTCVWEDSFLTLDLEKNWGANNTSITVEHNFYSTNLRKYAQQILGYMGLEINPKTYQIGTLDPEYNLDSFPSYIQDFSSKLQQDMGLFNGVFPNRYNTLIVGEPGKGKTKWSQAFACEVLAPLGYLILVVDYSSLQDIVLPNYIDKVCIIVNDADTLALDREFSQRGETEQVLSWLDGTRSTFIKPFLMEKRGSVITIMTANSVDTWDEAALRNGRIHKFKQFDGQTLSDS